MASEAMLLDTIGARIDSGGGFAVATLNLDHLTKLATDAEFRAAYAAQDLVTADGHPIVWMARLAGRPVALLPGADLIDPVLRLAAAKAAPVAFVGSTADSLNAAAARLRVTVPGLDIRACVAPPMGFDPDGDMARAILDDLAERGVRVVLLALGAPKQERLARMGRARHPGMGFLSIGAGLDFIGGRQRRAPTLVRQLALEWLWRAVSDPKRLGVRYLRSAAILPGHAWRAWAGREIPEAHLDARTHPMVHGASSIGDLPPIV